MTFTTFSFTFVCCFSGQIQTLRIQLAPISTFFDLLREVITATIVSLSEFSDSAD